MAGSPYEEAIEGATNSLRSPIAVRRLLIGCDHGGEVESIIGVAYPIDPGDGEPQLTHYDTFTVMRRIFMTETTTE